MDSYLDIARIVLRARRRPMGAKSILATAQKAEILPAHLFGKTQQKTLQARLSEDILRDREGSIFYRTEPGQYALKEFLNDPDYPAKWKIEFPARRRTRDLKRPDSLAIRRTMVASLENTSISMSEFSERLDGSGGLTVMQPKDMKKHGYCAIWTFSIVRRGSEVLSYRLGRYRDDRDTFANRRSIGFPGALAAEDVSLFSTDRLGVLDCAVGVLTQDLDLSLATFEDSAEQVPKIECVTALADLQGDLDLVIVLRWDSPDWFEPTTKRLSLNDPSWLKTSAPPNDINDFEPWSARLLGWLTAKGQAEFVHD
ncbi:winged helix-turn-helix domain-containing protein [Pseudooceanicola spongiae]|uniref:winged helix-turn-helix domain-containing protein n=1 Tax=Pseudooceanicola spongiae TaxID=2613965 RepID=UPI0018685572|nr:winged helix-turn-helix domain-containing protein [Pseudooceanicola spongiae]